MITRLQNLLGFYLSLAVRSVTDTGVYLRAALLPGKLLVVYSFLAYILLAAGHTTRYFWQTAPALTNQAQEIWGELVTGWPDDLEMKYANGSWTITPNEPLVIPYPSGYDKPDSLPSTLALVVPDSSSSTSAPIATNTAQLLLTPTEIVIPTTQGEPPRLSWNEILDTTEEIVLTKTVVQESTASVHELIEAGVRVNGSLLFAWWMFGVWLLRLLGLFLYAWLAQVFWVLRDRTLRYGTVYKMGLVMLPLPDVLLLIWRSAWPQLDLISYWWIWLILMAGVVLSAPRKD